MPYYDAYLIPISPAKLDAYRDVSRRIGAVYREYGALKIVDILLDDQGGDGASFHAEEARAALGDDLRDFAAAAGAQDGETVILSWTEWPDKQARDEGLAKVLADPRVQPDPEDGVIFEGRRLVSGAFMHLGSL
ncbi:MAG: hypothetical protein A2790_00105 [Phenylobacterium sp. RIFCSPHIGHO2_01_FULL_69_31]|uniref:DUF1428 domain-containing protein n=1 Tax=Phenylobacterium sp. RIFCSPHIGHO2_01_FULL_69_31 TaxID=1801944 RepID=UPI0008CC6254|nr:DUF1428 domain-containing protein [Phenylobacterium sp. RIFCSPHIGHO2_01_FULL_69_31]OHB27103.1 MAG: hypothetical protein A2790_00105 [Phenylobacterium sp. RIFCSPHIGHO2_01_FULL_69_31]